MAGVNIYILGAITVIITAILLLLFVRICYLSVPYFRAIHECISPSLDLEAHQSQDEYRGYGTMDAYEIQYHDYPSDDDYMSVALREEAQGRWERGGDVRGEMDALEKFYNVV